MLGGMDQSKTALERAFELAESGKYLTVDEVRRALKGEGYSDAELTGRTLVMQLRALITQAKR